MQNDVRAGVHVRDAVGIRGQVSRFREGELGEEVSYRRKGTCGRWGARKGDDQSVGDHKLGAVVSRQGVELRIVEIGDWGAGDSIV